MRKIVLILFILQFYAVSFKSFAVEENYYRLTLKRLNKKLEKLENYNGRSIADKK